MYVHILSKMLGEEHENQRDEERQKEMIPEEDPHSRKIYHRLEYEPC